MTSIHLNQKKTIFSFEHNKTVHKTCSKHYPIDIDGCRLVDLSPTEVNLFLEPGLFIIKCLYPPDIFILWKHLLSLSLSGLMDMRIFFFHSRCFQVHSSNFKRCVSSCFEPIWPHFQTCVWGFWSISFILSFLIYYP